MSLEANALPRVQVLRNAANALVTELVPKPTALQGTAPSEATDNLITLNSGKVDIGFWACSPGVFKTARQGVNEIILVLEGSGTLVSDHGERVDHSIGDVVLIPDGWSGAWHIHEYFKKQYLTVTS